MSTLNDYLNTLGQAVHQAAQASQGLENEYKAAEARVAQMDELDEKAKALKKEVAELSAAKTVLDAQLVAVRADKQRLLDVLKTS